MIDRPSLREARPAGCLCDERGLLGLHETPCEGYGTRSDELCEQAYREHVAEVGREPVAQRQCAKCGGRDILVHWHEKGGSSECGYFAKVKVYGEHLHATCRTCRFEWGEDTLDNLG